MQITFRIQAFETRVFTSWDRMGNYKDLASNSVYVVMLRGVSCLGGCLQFPNASSWLIIYFYCVCVCVCLCS